MIIAIYGVSGAGKTTIGKQLSSLIAESIYFSEYEIIKSYFSGNFDAYIKLSEDNRQKVREISIGGKLNEIQKSKHTTIVDCHFSFPLENLGTTDNNNTPFHVVMPKDCIRKYDLIVYLDTSVSDITKRLSSLQTTYKNRVESEIIAWQNFEKKHLKYICNLNNVPYFEVRNDTIQNCVSAIEIIMEKHRSSTDIV